jgi:methionyl-tRNA synthetase
VKNLNYLVISWMADSARFTQSLARFSAKRIGSSVSLHLFLLSSSITKIILLHVSQLQLVMKSLPSLKEKSRISQFRAHTFDWGIPVPWDTKQVIYVWFDALLNYATAVGLGDATGSAGAEKFAQTWPADVHLVGKDILRFHAVIWPAMLMAAGLPLPKKVFAHGWLLVGGEKMSKSKLTGIAPSDITDHFGVDAFVTTFLRAIPFGSDGSFSWEDMSARYTSELANDFGNLASRLIAMIEKYCDGAIPAVARDAGLESALAETVQKADTAMVALDFQGGINAIMEFCKRVNGYVTEREPWIVAKDESRRVELMEILDNTADSIRALAVLLHSVMPATCETLWSALGMNSDISAQKISDVAAWGQIAPGSRVTKGAVLFPRLEEPAAK